MLMHFFESIFCSFGVVLPHISRKAVYILTFLSLFQGLFHQGDSIFEERVRGSAHRRYGTGKKQSVFFNIIHKLLHNKHLLFNSSFYFSLSQVPSVKSPVSDLRLSL